jgi:hypothetical protein
MARGKSTGQYFSCCLQDLSIAQGWKRELLVVDIFDVQHHKASVLLRHEHARALSQNNKQAS